LYKALVCILLVKGIGKKAAYKNGGEIDYCRRFHQRFTHAFFVQIFRQRQYLTRKSCQKRLSYKKASEKR